MDTARKTKVKASQHESYWAYSILAFLLPGIALILGIAYMVKDNKLDKRLGEHTLVLSILALLIYGTAISIWQMTSQEAKLNETRPTPGYHTTIYE